MTQHLELLLADGIIDEVLGQLKSGKEAEVWLVRHAGETVAAKVYKERDFRSFKNNAEYKEGRQVRNTRTQRAMDKGSRFGQQAAEEAWKAAEASALSQLHAAGVRVPKPVLFYEGVLLMEVVVDAEGHVAPRLVDAPIAREQAAGLYAVLRTQAVKMLCADLIHGDLSEFNVLLAYDGPMLIDLPQVISAAQNSRAEHFFKRDVDNLRRFFATIDPAIADRRSDADEIWRAYVRRDLTPEFEPSGRAAVSAPPQGGRGGNRNRNRQQKRRGENGVPSDGAQARGAESQRPQQDQRPQNQQGQQRTGSPQGQRRSENQQGQRRSENQQGQQGSQNQQGQQRPQNQQGQQRPQNQQGQQRPQNQQDQQRSQNSQGQQRSQNQQGQQRSPNPPRPQNPPRGPQVSYRGVPPPPQAPAAPQSAALPAAAAVARPEGSAPNPNAGAGRHRRRPRR